MSAVAASAAPLHDQAGKQWERTIMVNGDPVLTTDQMFWSGETAWQGFVAPPGLD